MAEEKKSKTEGQQAQTIANPPHVEIVLPVYNEVKNLLPLIKAIDDAVATITDKATVTYLFVNDGSKDGSRQLLHRMYRERTDFRIIDFVHNFGHSAALSCGIDACQGDAVVFMDADMQDSPTAIPEMFAAWQKGARTVVAERGERPEKAGILFKAFYFILHKTARNLPPINFGTFCLLDKTVVERLRLLKERNRYFPGLVAYASADLSAVKIDRQNRAHGESRVGMLGLFNLAITALLSFSNAPVRLVSLIGLASAGLALTLGLGIVAIKLFTPLAIPGWASIMTATALGSGIQLLCLGLIGEYVARIYEEVKGRPIYLVDRQLERRSGRKAKDAA